MARDDDALTGPPIRLRGLVKRWGRTVALAGIDLDLPAERIVGVVGPDGAGKTTLLRALAGLLDVEARDETVLGHDLRRDTTTLKARIGYVPQSFGLHRDLSVLENLRFTARLHRIPDDVFTARVTPLLERTALAPFGDRPAGALSGGMKQKLAVVNALLPEPALLVLDEPTAGIDVVARGELWALLEGARATALVVISTSYLEEAARCDHLVYMDAGRIVATGDPASLRARVGLECYRAWGPHARAIAVAARALPYVRGARAAGRYARIEVAAARSPGTACVLADLHALHAGPVQLAERVETDMEATLLALAEDAA
jgi:ABC-2 type transport system ATP-binding protein